MTFAASEASLDAGTPYELHEFREWDSSTWWRYADAPAHVTYGGSTFTALYIQGGRIEQGATALKNRTIVKCDWDNPFAAQYLVCAPEEPIVYTRYKGHGADVQAIFMGEVVDVLFRQRSRQGDRWAEIAIDPLTAALRRSGLTTRCSRQCDADLFDERCKVLRAGYKVQGTVDAVDGTTLTSTTFGTFDDDWFTGGDIVVNGRRRWILDHAAETIVIWPQLPGLAAGQAYEAYPGCNHLAGATGDCYAKFDNLANYQGQPNTPDENPWNEWGIL